MWSELLPFAKDWGPPGLILAAIVTGWLVPRWMHRERIADFKDQISTLRASLERAERQRDELIELSRTATAAFQALPRSHRVQEPL